MTIQTKKNLLIAGAAVLALAIILVAVLGSTGRGSEKATLTDFYTAMYCDEGGGIDAIVDCLLPAMQQEFYNNTTMGGTNFSQLSTWRMEAMQLVGDNIKVKVELQDSLEESATGLASIRQVYPDVQRYRVVSFKLTLTGSEGTEDFLGVMPLALVDGRWYLGADDANLKRVVNTAE